MFRTEINILPSQFTVGLKDPIITIGSCFSDSIGAHFEINKFEILKNPFGTVYNPLSIFKLLNYALKNSQPPATTYIEHDGLHSNYDFHSSYSSLQKEELKKNISESILQTNQFIEKTNCLIITLGTAYIYKEVESGVMVANCHKLPAKRFTKHLLTQKQILQDFDSLYVELAERYPSMNIILTVSPVRHIKDTLELNSVSKSTLRLACNTLSEQYKNVHYFPSYEIMLDDLRDYRFYKEDMIHPTAQAEDYIWGKFQQMFIDAETQKFIKDWSKIVLAINHRPFNPTSAKHQDFIKQTIRKIETLDATLDFSKELSHLNSMLL